MIQRDSNPLPEHFQLVHKSFRHSKNEKFQAVPDVLNQYKQGSINNEEKGFQFMKEMKNILQGSDINVENI